MPILRDQVPQPLWWSLGLHQAPSFIHVSRLHPNDYRHGDCDLARYYSRRVRSDKSSSPADLTPLLPTNRFLQPLPMPAVLSSAAIYLQSVLNLL